MKIVVESPLSGNPRKNMRFALWCCRALVFEGHSPLASHLGAPWYLDDYVPTERSLGMQSEWYWEKDTWHYFFLDLGMSRGMEWANNRCEHKWIPTQSLYLKEYSKECYEQFAAGEWPAHTSGFEVVV